MPHVFISYVHENEKDVQKLCDELTRHGVKVWLDRDDIKPGSRWRDAIREAIQQGDFFIACFSGEYQRRDKTFMNEELGLAVEELKKYRPDRPWFIPVLLEDCDVPSFSISDRETLLDIQWVALFLDWDAGIQRILDVIQPIPASVQRLIEAIDSDDDEVRVAATEALGKTAHEEALPVLIKLTADKNQNVRIHAISALGKIGEPAVPTLIEVFTNRYSDIRANAASALGGIGGPSTIRVLTEAIDDEDHKIRQIVVSVLSKIGDPAVFSLIKALSDGHGDVRASAAIGLGKTRNPEAVPALIEALKDEYDVIIPLNAASALGAIGDPKAVPALIKALSDEYWAVRANAASALGAIGGPKAVPALIKALGDENYNVREFAAIGLREIGDSKAVHALIEALKDVYGNVREYAAEALGGIEDAEAVPALIEALGDENSDVREAVAAALQMINTTQALKAVEEYELSRLSGDDKAEL